MNQQPAYESDASSPLARDGCLIIPADPATLALCDAVNRDIDQLMTATGVQSRVQDAWRQCDSVRRLATHPPLMALLAQAFGREAFAFQTLNFQVGTGQEIHTDTVHFNAKPEGFMCAAWVALEDIAIDSGPLRYYPGSHKLPRITMSGAGVKGRRSRLSDYHDHYVPTLNQHLQQSGIAPREAILRKGETFIWVANLAHGGAPILRHGASRRSMVTHYYFRDCFYYTPMLSDEDAGDCFVRFPQDLATGRIVVSRQIRWTVQAGIGLAKALYGKMTRRVIKD